MSVALEVEVLAVAMKNSCQRSRLTLLQLRVLVRQLPKLRLCIVLCGSHDVGVVL